MKKGLCLMLCLLLSPLASLAALNDNTAREKALDILAAQGIKAEDVRIYQSGFFEEDGGFWRVSLLRRQELEEEDNLYLVDMRSDGSLHHLKLPQLLSDEQLIRKAFRKAALPLTSESLMALQTKLGPRLEGIISRNINKENAPGQNVAPACARALQLDIHPPASGALSLEEAEAKARAAIEVTAPWSKEKLAMYPPFLAAHYVSAELGRPVWHFVFEQEDISNSARFVDKDWDYYDSVYGKPLVKLFGKNADTPLYVSLRLDATSGQVLGEVATFYPTLSSAPPYYLIR